ncbi:MAG: hypothetical protein ABH952_02020 [Candidatus Omnitrophota bacterium]
MAWDKTKPENDMLLINFPAACRANWDAIELGTDPVLQITNDKVAPNAGIVDTKLAQITSPNKVSGSALVGLSSVPQAAGVLPADNSPNKLKADASDTTPEYLDALIDAAVFQVSASDQLQLKDGGVQTQKLEGGSQSPGNTKYYGTNAIGTKGFFDMEGSKVKATAGDPTPGYLDAKVDNSSIEVSGVQLRVKSATPFVGSGYGTTTYGGVIPLPAGFSEGQCAWTAGINYALCHPDPFDGFKCQLSGRTVLCQLYDYHLGWQSGGVIANYMIMGVR